MSKINKLKTIFRSIIKTLLFIVVAYLVLMIIVMLIMYWTMFSERDGWAAAMVKQCNRDFENCIISAEQVTDFDWDRMYIFEMAVSDERVKEELGFNYISDKGEISKRRTIFVKNDQAVHKQLDSYNSFESRPNNSTIINYNMGDPAYYVALDKNEAIFKITQTMVDDSTYYYMTPIALK